MKLRKWSTHFKSWKFSLPRQHKVLITRSSPSCNYFNSSHWYHLRHYELGSNYIILLSRYFQKRKSRRLSGKERLRQSDNNNHSKPQLSSQLDLLMPPSTSSSSSIGGGGGINWHFIDLSSSSSTSSTGQLLHESASSANGSVYSMAVAAASNGDVVRVGAAQKPIPSCCPNCGRPASQAKSILHVSYIEEATEPGVMFK